MSAKIQIISVKGKLNLAFSNLALIEIVLAP